MFTKDSAKSIASNPCTNETTMYWFGCTLYLNYPSENRRFGGSRVCLRLSIAEEIDS